MQERAVGLTVRDATAPDAAEIRTVAIAAWRDTYAALLQTATIESFVDPAYSIDRLERRIAGHTFLVATDDDRIVAFADGIAETDRLTLAAIYALPDRRGEGAGTLLLTTLRARHADLPIAADVLLGNRKGELFYERKGFVPAERIEADLRGEHIVERRWWLGGPPPAAGDR